MSLLTVVQDVCAAVGVEIPTTVFTSIANNRTMQEMVALANEMAQRIAYDTREWTRLKTQVTFTGDGVLVPPVTGVMAGTTAFALPANYKRMLLTAQVWRSTSTLQPMRFIADTDQWLQRRAANEVDAWGEWTLLGDYMHIYPIMAAAIPAAPPLPAVPAVTARFPYLDRNCVVLNAGGNGERFVNDLDRFRLDERLLKLGMTWQWKAQKGSPYAEDMGTYGDALQVAMGSDKPSPIIIGRSPISSTARVAYPFPVPTP
jgi:hypothetical protein